MMEYFASNKKYAFDKFLKTWEDVQGMLLIEKQTFLFYNLIAEMKMILCFCYLLHFSAGEGNGTPLQYSCLENPMDGGAW